MGKHHQRDLAEQLSTMDLPPLPEADPLDMPIPGVEVSGRTRFADEEPEFRFAEIPVRRGRRKFRDEDSDFAQERAENRARSFRVKGHREKANWERRIEQDVAEVVANLRTRHGF